MNAEKKYSKNPYKYTGPLDPEKNKPVCVSRHEEIQIVITGINNGDYFIILGPRQTGKTTFLRQIENTFTNAYCLYMNFQSLPGNPKDFYQGMIEQLLERIPHDSHLDTEIKEKPGEETVPAPETTFFRILESFRPEDEDKKIIFLFDDFGDLTLLQSFLDKWRKRYHDPYGSGIRLERYGIILTGREDFLKMKRTPNSSFNFAQILYLKDFTWQEARQLIDDPFNQLKISIDGAAKEKLVAQTGGHPQMLQQSCHFLVNRGLEKGTTLDEKDVNDALKNLTATNYVLELLKEEVKQDQALGTLLKDVLNGKKNKYLGYKELSISGSGPIIEFGSYCGIRNQVYEEFLRNILTPRREVLIEIPSQDQYLNRKNKTPMPCAVKQIKVKNYYGINETGIELPLDARWIFLTGENAYGKTAVLRALVIGMYGPREENTILLDTARDSRIAVEIYHNGENRVNDVGTLQFKSFTRFAAYGSSRLEIQSPRTNNDITGKSSKTYGLFNTDGLALNIEYDLLLWYLKGDKRFDTVKNILLELMPHGADISVDREKNEILYIEKENKEDGDATFDPVSFQELALGNRSIIAMIGDLIIRFYNEYPSPDIHPQDFEGIVIIDELDIHFHPRWLRKLPGILSKIFPKIQFIVSTHSEIPLLGAPKQSVFLKVTRTQKEGIQIRRLPIDIKNLLSHHLLTSPIFDLGPESIPETNEKIADLRAEDSYQEIQKIDKIKNDLKTFEKSSKDFPGDLFDTGYS